MKLHLPARLRSALLACLTVVAPLVGTVATGTFVGGAVVASLSFSESHAAVVEIPTGVTVDYDASNSYVLKGGTLRVEQGIVSSAVTIGAAESTIYLGTGASLSPLRVSLADGVTAYKLAGTGTYDLASATSVYGANVTGSDWTGTVSIANATGVDNFNINNYGSSASTVRLSGVAGWLAIGVAFNPTLLLEDTADRSAFNQTDGSTGREYAFRNVIGSGTFERGGTKFSGAVTYAFSGDVSGWTGTFLNNFGQTTLVFRGAASEINLASITNNSGYEMGLSFTGSNATVVNSLIQAPKDGTIKAVIDNIGGVTFARNAAFSSLEVKQNSSMTVAYGARVSVSSIADINGPVTVAGTLHLDGGAILNAGIVNNGTLSITGVVTVSNPDNFLQRPVGDVSFSNGDNGFLESGSVEYVIVENSASAGLNASDATVSLGGKNGLKLSSAGTVQADDVSSAWYWVNDGVVSFNATGAPQAPVYYMNGENAVLELDKTDAAAQGSALVSVKGKLGTIRLTQNASFTGAEPSADNGNQEVVVATQSAARLEITNGATLSVGAGKNTPTYANSFSAVVLDNGNLKINAKPGTIWNLGVTANNGEINFADYINAPTADNAYMFSGVTQLDGKLTVKGAYKYVTRFNRLSGAGSMEFNGPTSAEDTTQALIDSLDGFTGDLSFVQNNDSNPYYKVTLNTGSSAVSMGALTVGKKVDKSADQKNIDVVLTVGAGMTLNKELTMLSNSALTVSGADGLELKAGLVVQGVDNTLTVQGDSALDLSRLNVSNGAALSLIGKYSGLAMNQQGSVSLADMLLVDGASLVYGADCAPLQIGAGNLAGAVRVDLNSLTDAQSVAIADGSGLELGIAGEVSKNLISVVADNVRDAKLDNSSGSWKLVSGVVSQFWEAADGSGVWNGSEANWAFRDGATANQTFKGGTDAIFSGHENAVVSIDDVASIDVQNIEISNGNYTFNYATDSSLVVKNDLVVESVNNMFAGNVEVQGALQGEGHLVVAGNLDLGKSSEIGDMFVTGTVTMTGTNTPEERNTDLTVTGTSASCTGLENVGKLSLHEGATMTVNPGDGETVSIETLTGAGSLSVGGTDTKLELTGNEQDSSSFVSDIGAIETSSLILDKGVTLTVGTLTTPEVNATFTPAVIDNGSILFAGQTVGETTLKLTVDSVDDLRKLTNGQVVTIAAVAQPGGTITGDLIAPTAPNPETSVDEWTGEKKGFSVTSNLRGFGYELKVSDDNKQVTMVVSRNNKGWIGEGVVWTNGESNGWDGDAPSADTAAGFFGFGSSDVQVDRGGVSTALVDVDIAMDKLDEISSYTFMGGSVTADNMVIGQGELRIANATQVTGDTQVYSNGALTVVAGGSFENDAAVSLTDKVSLTVEEGGEFSVMGDFTAEESVAIENAGDFTAAQVDIAKDINNSDGTLRVLVGGSIGGAVNGGRVILFDNGSDCSLQVDSMNVDSLAINGENSALSLSDASVIGALSGNDSVVGESLISTAAVTLKDAAQGGVNLKASALTINSVGNKLGKLDVPQITVDLTNGSGLSTEVAALSVESLAAADTVGITLTQSTISSMPLNEDGIIVAGNYKLISGIGAFTENNFSVGAEVLQEIRRRGVEVGVGVEDDALVLSLGSLAGGMVWNTAEGQVTNNGYVVPTGAGLYKALDYVEHVLVSDNKVIDLTAEGVGNAATDATEASVGLIIRGLDGGGSLMLKGDAAGEGGVLPDVATLISAESAATPVALVADSVRVNLGLPADARGVLTKDAASDSVVLSSVALENGSVLQVNGDATVNGQTDLGGATSLVVADGAALTTRQLDGDESAVISGKVNITGVGGAYAGGYGESGAEIELKSGAYQSVRAGKGLTFILSGGEGTLDMAGAETEVTKLGVGTQPGAAEKIRSELVIANVTHNNDAGRVEHHTLNVVGSGSYIADSEVTVSLGAEETARTLGTDQAPVILNGAVDISNSAVCVTMVTSNDNLRSLDVNTDAPMAGAKLATLVTDGSVTGDNSVELIGTRAVMNVVNKYYTNARLAANGDVLVDRVTDYYASQTAGVSETGRVGVSMLDKVLVKLNPQAKSQEYPDLNNVLNALDDAVVAGNTAAADELASAVTGVSAAAMGAAVVGDMERQLRTIRNRTTTMGVDQSTVNHNMPYFNAWINAEYDNRQLDADGMLAGYDYSVTGGTFGFDVDVTPRFVCGLAVSALTGDVSSDGPDNLDADVDSYYLTVFGRTTYRRWTHTFVASVGKSDLSVDRTVSFSGGSYRTKGETEATSFGAMYELGYVFALDADASTCLQPVFNITVAHSSMDGYTESGSDAALAIGGVDMTAVTIGMGARLQAIVGQSTFNRSSIFESRALLKVNAGDRDAEADTALISLPTASGKVSSAERGPVSLELGAGITVPVGAISGAIYVDGSAEFGAEYTGLNATVGYRLNF